VLPLLNIDFAIKQPVITILQALLCTPRNFICGAVSRTLSRIRRSSISASRTTSAHGAGTLETTCRGNAMTALNGGQSCLG